MNLAVWLTSDVRVTRIVASLIAGLAGGLIHGARLRREPRSFRRRPPLRRNEHGQSTGLVVIAVSIVIATTIVAVTLKDASLLRQVVTTAAGYLVGGAGLAFVAKKNENERGGP